MAGTILHPDTDHICDSVCGSATDIIPVQKNFSGQSIDFFSSIFQTDDWPARWHCGNWSDFHGWLYIFSDLLIWGCYFVIPLLLYRLIMLRKDLPFSKIFWLFGAFIILCGTTHLLDAIIFWWPAYRLSALVRLCTGIVSFFTVIALSKILPKILSLRTVDELEQEIRERKIVEEKLAANEFLLSEAERVGKVGGWERDLITNKAIWSKSIYSIFGLPEGHDIDNLNTTSFFPEPHKRRLLEAISDARKDGKAWDMALQIVNVKKETIWIRSICQPILDEHGKVVKLRGVLMDINDYKNNEIALNQSMQLLIRQNKQLQSFTHILSHNIRNHTANISILISMMDKETLDNNNREMYNLIEKVSHNLNGTLDDLSEAIKIRENTIEPEPLRFSEIAQNIMETLKPNLIANQGTIETDFKVDNIRFPKVYLQSILINLLSNSIKYRRADVNPNIVLRTYKDDNENTVLECSDNGIGIDLELHRDKMFGLYKTFHTNENASGVGLFLVKLQVESQNGEIVVNSKLGVGTTFKIIFNEQN